MNPSEGFEEGGSVVVKGKAISLVGGRDLGGTD